MATDENSKTFTARENQLQSLAQVWMNANPSHQGANSYTITSEIDGAAFDGNARAKGLAGQQ